MAQLIEFPGQREVKTERTSTHVTLGIQIRSWRWLAVKVCGVDWVESVLLSELSLVRAKKLLGEQKQ